MNSFQGKSRKAWAQYASLLQQQYAEALQQDDLPTLIECCGGLSIAYSSMECNPLADRWMDEYLNLLERIDPGIRKRVQTIRDILPQ